MGDAVNDRDRLERKRLIMERKLQSAVLEFEKLSGLRVTSIRMSPNSRTVLSEATLLENDGIPVLTQTVTLNADQTMTVRQLREALAKLPNLGNQFRQNVTIKESDIQWEK